MEDKTLRITSPEPEDSDSSKLNIDNAETDGFDSDDGMFTDSEVEIDPDGELFLFVFRDTPILKPHSL